MNSFVSTLQQLGPARLAVMGAIVLGLLMFFVFISMRVTTPEMKLLYTDLSSIDSGAVAAKLEETSIPYEMSSDGSRIMVPGNEVGRARMLLAAEGLPNGGSMGYEIFDTQSSFGTTNFVQNINQVRALEGELSRTINSLEHISTARVHIVLPQRELFSRERRTASASVFLGIHSGSTIGRQQIAAIQSLVASAVPNLKASDVSVIDSNGNLLAKGGSEDDSLMSMKNEDLRRNYEARLQNKIEEQVSRIVGYGKVTAVVTAEMNFDRISTNEELYNPEGQVLRSSQTSQENSSETEASSSDDVSIGNNLPGVGGDLLSDGGPSAENSRTEEVSNYEISKTIRSTLHESGEVEKISISVLVDGRYTTDEEGVKTYQPRPQAELDQIEALIKRAVGFEDDRGDDIEIVNLQFAEVDIGEDIANEHLLFGFQKSDLIDAAEIIIVAVMVILVVLLVLQPMVSKLMSADMGGRNEMDPTLQHDLLAASPANPALAPPGAGNAPQIGADGQPLAIGASAIGEEEDSLINVDGIEGRVKASAVKKVEEIVENYPAETVSVIRSWMTQEN
ncbi:MAG: flagellar basal-body MS-ring/collar protein FliF [Alphaproteobacteria bacterium]